MESLFLQKIIRLMQMTDNHSIVGSNPTFTSVSELAKIQQIGLKYRSMVQQLTYVAHNHKNMGANPIRATILASSRIGKTAGFEPADWRFETFLASHEVIPKSGKGGSLLNCQVGFDAQVRILLTSPLWLSGLVVMTLACHARVQGFNSLLGRHYMVWLF